MPPECCRGREIDNWWIGNEVGLDFKKLWIQELEDYTAGGWAFITHVKDVESTWRKLHPWTFPFTS
jgi:hypothetical protein